MNGAPLLEKIAKALTECHLEAVLIGNAAAALHGAPVTTMDFDFMFRKTEANLEKIKKLASHLGGTVRRPFHPASGLYRVTNEAFGLQVDFMSVVHGVRSFSSLKSRGKRVSFGGVDMLIASLPDIIASKKAADRPHDRAVLDVLQKTLDEAKKGKTHKT